ncbi:PP2C family protein-serine/threonine phosphatase [Actinomadura fibrosa]|uniref:PP2C family protein-serine/threonine phosphatase n=1 Tax=Actinomadura fibrosa TaxID=111802 RepID=A0ABW2XIB9_9ACTN|nr:PP2C family protein-serine/threonine phosphatase [Actinomadura fibrosa]
MEVTQGVTGARRLDHVLHPPPCPALAVDASGVIADLNDAAGSLLSAAAGSPLAGTVPEWLTTAHNDFRRGPDAHAEPASGPIGERVFEARPKAREDRADGAAYTVWWLFDVTDRQRLTRELTSELATERERTAFLAEASTRLLASLNLERCMEATAGLAARHLADAAMVIAPGTGRAYPVARCGPDGRVEYGELLVDPAEVPGLAEAMQGFPPVPSRWIDPSTAPDWVARGAVRDPGAMVVTALPGHGVPAGALVLLRERGREAFSAGEELFAQLFAARAGAAMSAARLYAEQASITETLMRDLLPPRVRELDGVELAARYRPSGDGERVGGDFYDLYPAAGSAPGPDGESLVVLGDVCGKGLEAAVLTGKIRNTLRALLSLAGDHRRVLELLNATLLDTVTARFVTLVMASVSRQGAQARLRLTSAGHAAPLVVRASGRVETVATGGSLIGVLDTITSTSATVLLEPGDTCLLYTDGVTEAVGGPLGEEMFGEARLRAELEQCGGMPPEALVERVHMLASQWAGGRRRDDLAVIAITAPRRFHLSAVGGHGPGRFTA